MKMTIQPGNEITIMPCEELDALRLSELAGKRAVVTEDLTIPERRQVGYMVRLLDGKFMNEENWYLPFNAVCHA
jgi:hypothetical protein|nr:MAG TPA_asm: hypothetical protein [Caudoviricetes sp.]